MNLSSALVSPTPDQLPRKKPSSAGPGSRASGRSSAVTETRLLACAVTRTTAQGIMVMPRLRFAGADDSAL
jgi:hypothetical protein